MDFCFFKAIKHNRGEQRIFEIWSYIANKASKLFDWFGKSLLFKALDFLFQEKKFDTCPLLET